MKPERESRSVVSDSLQPHGLHSSWNFSRPECRSGQPFPSPGDLPNPGIEPRSAALPSDSIPAEPPGKPKNTEESSLSLLQGIFPPQESNWGLLNCRQILYQLSYQGLNHAGLPSRVTELSGIVCPGTIWPQTFPILISAF